jgi:hypothetical protein
MKTEQIKTKNPEKLLRRSFRQRPALVYVFLFLAGMTGGMLLSSLLRSDLKSLPADTVHYLGTLIDQGNTGDWKSAGTLFMQEWQMKATCQARYNESLVELYLNLSSGDPMVTTIEFEPDDFEFKMVVSEKVASETTISTASGQVIIRSAGENRLAVRLANLNDRQHPVILRITQNDNQIYQNSISINSPE